MPIVLKGGRVGTLRIPRRSTLQQQITSPTSMSSLVAFITGGISSENRERLFQKPYAAVAILRSLPPLARHLLLRFACAEGGVNAALVASWASQEGASRLTAVLEDLTALHLLAQIACDGQTLYAVSAGFCAQLRHVMCRGLLAAGQAAKEPAAPLLAPGEAAAFARQQWEALLLYLVSGEGSPPGIPPGMSAEPIDIPDLLTAAGLMVKDEYTLRQSISEKGFHFLLQDLYSQLWSIVRQYLVGLDLHGSHSGDLAVAVNFLLRLGLQSAGHAVSLQQLSPDERKIAAHMCQLGLLAPAAAANELWVHPTRLAATLAGAGEAGRAAPEDGFIIVESNFRVYAYTTSSLQVAILRVFVRCDALLPNLFVGTITRESATSALALGITAEQMVAFLQQRAHPRAAARTPRVPAVVADQLRLWQQELNRLQLQGCALYDKFESAELYSGAVAHAKKLGAWLYSSDEHRQLAVAAEFHELMKTHLRERKLLLGL